MVVHMCPIHNVPLKTRVTGLLITKNTDSLTEKEWQGFVDRRHHFSAASVGSNIIEVCPHCGYGVRVR